MQLQLRIYFDKYRHPLRVAVTLTRLVLNDHYLIFPHRVFSCTMILSHKERQDQNLPQPILSSPVHRDSLYIYTVTMIQVYTDSFKLSQDYYNNIVFSLPLDRMECTCGASGSLIFYGSYNRSVKCGGTVLVLRIQRVRCRKCGKTHAILLSSLIPYSMISLQDQQQIIYHALTAGSCSDVMDRNPLIDETNVRHILRRFRMYWQDPFPRPSCHGSACLPMFLVFLPTVHADPENPKYPFCMPT